MILVELVNVVLHANSISNRFATDHTDTISRLFLTHGQGRVAYDRDQKIAVTSISSREVN